MNTCRRHALAFVALAALLALRCSWDAPRDNPLDPTLGGNVRGRVLTRRATPIAAARVELPAAGRAVETDSAGSFELRSLPEESTWVCVAAAGYVPDSTLVALAKGRIDTMTTYLNGLPFLQDCRLTTHVYARDWPTEPLEFCELSATAGDADGDADLDSVWAEIPAISYTERLPYDPDEKVFIQTLWADDLPGQSMETLVGREVRFNVADEEGAAATVTVAGITRIMTDLPEPVFPSGGQDTLSSDTVFIWYRFNHGYAVSYHSEVVRVEGGSPAGIAAEFDAADTAYRLASTSLDSGDYYWTVEAIDEFGNSSRSAEELFHVR
jgi:hypothetical protein